MEMSLRWASVSPSMYRWVVWIDRWPASSCTSRNEPPALWTNLAARVMNVRRPEWDEQPSRPTARYARANQTTMLSEVIAPPRSERTTGPVAAAMPRQSIIASRSSLCIGINLPLRFFAAWSRSSIAEQTAPVEPRSMSHVKLAISPARRPALAESRTITRLRSGFRLAEAYIKRSCKSSSDNTFACLPDTNQAPSTERQKYMRYKLF